MKPRAIIVDGYNVLRATSAYSELADRDLPAARDRLLVDAETLSGCERRCTVVFDGGSNPGSDGHPRRWGSVSVIFSPFGRTADDVVEALAARARVRKEPTVVVTSDVDVRSASAGDPVTFMAADRFLAEVAEASSRIREQVGHPSRRGPVQGRIAPRTRAELERWARGER